ncbi:MAG UNVERIFIED_CONTAM: hypothetical protein LVT10_17800 [Anaerolineae bacterium]|jgi:amylosucrase
MVKAKAGDETYRDYYRIFPDRTLPDQYQRTLREIFPETAPGAFTWIPEVQGWVWTTFYPFQWDLNYDNPQVFASMMGEMLFLANVGVDVLRLDAVAFVWKQMGTGSENLPQAHQIIRALNAIARSGGTLAGVQDQRRLSTLMMSTVTLTSTNVLSRITRP